MGALSGREDREEIKFCSEHNYQTEIQCAMCPQAVDRRLCEVGGDFKFASRPAAADGYDTSQFVRPHPPTGNTKERYFGWPCKT